MFHETWLNYVDECSIKRSTRIFVGIVSLISILTGDPENTHLYLLLTNSPNVDMKNYNLIRSKPLFIVILILFTTSIIIHSRIEMFKKQVDSQSKVEENYQEGNCEYSMNTGRIIICIGSILILIMVFYLFNIRIEMFKKQVDSQSKVRENYQEGNCEYSMNTGRIIICIGSILILIMVFYLSTIETEIEKFYIRRHESLALVQFFNMNVIPMILIVRNENMLHFFRNEIKTFSLYMVMCPLFVIYVLSCKQL